MPPASFSEGPLLSPSAKQVTGVVCPVVMSLIVVTIIIQRIYEANTGLLNTFLRGSGLEAIAHPWLGDPATALGAVIAVSVWKNVGFSLVILLAGLQGLPRDVIDAGRGGSAAASCGTRSCRSSSVALTRDSPWNLATITSASRALARATRVMPWWCAM